MWVTPCLLHDDSLLGVTAWVWSRTVLPCTGCPCDVADRFLVAADRAPARWRQVSDVVVCASKPTTNHARRHACLRLADLPGCAIVVVPLDATGITTIHTRTEYVTVPASPERLGQREMAAYPWIAAGYQLRELPTAVCGGATMSGGFMLVG